MRKAVAAAIVNYPDLLDAMREFPVEERGEINRSKLGWLLKKNANRIVGGFEFQQAEADGRTAWRVVAVKSPPLPPLPPSAPSAEKTVAGWSTRLLSAAEALKAARAAGIELVLDGDDLALSAASAPPAAVLDALSRHKAEIVALLRPGRDGWSAEDWQAYFDERAGIAEFDGGLSRAEAEARAFECCVVEWLNRNPARSPPGRCLGCGDREHAHDPLLPYGTEPDRPRLAAFALLARLARNPEGQGRRRPISLWNAHWDLLRGVRTRAWLTGPTEGLKVSEEAAPAIRTEMRCKIARML